jgi:isoleucyl-tRNA synthetase
VAGELNVRALEALGTVGDDLVDHVVKPNFRTLGRRFASRTQAVAAAITAVDPATLASQLAAAGEASVPVGGEAVTIGPDDVIVTQTPRAGWSVATEGGETVALDLDVTPELRREGLAREVIRLVQDARKADGLEVSDRIALRWEAPNPELAAALTEHRLLIAGEVLATEFGPLSATSAEPAAGSGAGTEHRATDLGLTFWIRRS